jgi:hypothetical protein
MHEREPRRRGGERERGLPGRVPDEDEEERDDGRHEQLPRRRAGKLERRVRAAAAGRERDHADLRSRNRAGEPRGAEDSHPELVRDHDGERREDARLVEDDRRRVDAAELRDEREPPVPERERIARVQPAVGELVDGPERERAEVAELADPPEVEERVALHEPLEAPERDPEADARECSGTGAASPGRGDGGCGERTRRRRRCVAPAEAVPGTRTKARGTLRVPGTRSKERGAGAHDQHEDERQRQRRVHGERDRERTGDDRDRPRERRRGAALPERARDEAARREQDERRRGETQPESEAVLGQEPRDAEQDESAEQAHPSSWSTRPDASHAAPSRYVAPR